MNGKRLYRQADENCGNNLNLKRVKVDHPAECSSDASLETKSGAASSKIQSSCITQIDTASRPALSDGAASIEAYSKKDLVLELLSLMIDEFNCNHQADLEDANGRVEIYTRNKEQKAINSFIRDNMAAKASALMYICGHPGTGKTSTLNLVLSGLVSGDVKANLLSKLSVTMYNAMSFKDVKSFCLQLLNDYSQKFTGAAFIDPSKKGGVPKKGDYDDDEMALLVAKLLGSKPDQTKILVIDEVDAFQSNEYAFKQLAKAILTTHSNTLIIGIANSVDLPFKKKQSAIAMRDAQLLFEPYSEDQIVQIIEEKTNQRFPTFPLRLKQNKEIVKIFRNLFDEKAKGIIAKRVSKLNGDMRVAFDIVKSSCEELYSRVKYAEAIPDDAEIQVSFELVVKLFQSKYGSKLPQILRSLPRQNLIVLEAITNLYSDSPECEDRKLTYFALQAEVKDLCSKRGLTEIMGQGVSHFMEELSFYNIIEVERPKGHDQKRDIKQSLFWLKVEYHELNEELNALLDSK